MTWHYTITHIRLCLGHVCTKSTYLHVKLVLTSKSTCVTCTIRSFLFIMNSLLFSRYAIQKQNTACHSRSMAAIGIASMISPPSSISNGTEPSQLPPYPPPIRTGQALQPLSVFTGTNRACHCKWNLFCLFESIGFTSISEFLYVRF